MDGKYVLVLSFFFAASVGAVRVGVGLMVWAVVEGTEMGGALTLFRLAFLSLSPPVSDPDRLFLFSNFSFRSEVKQIRQFRFRKKFKIIKKRTLILILVFILLFWASRHLASWFVFRFWALSWTRCAFAARSSQQTWRTCNCRRSAVARGSWCRIVWLIDDNRGLFTVTTRKQDQIRYKFKIVSDLD